MQRERALEILREHQEELRRLGVKSLALFGSTVRGEATPESDIDLLVEFSRPVGLFAFFDVQQYLESILGCKVDLGTPDSLRPHLRENIFKEAEAVYVT